MRSQRRVQGGPRNACAKFFALGAPPVRDTNTLDNQGGLRRSKI
jgi:hypothetical protein